ncbi:DUF2189 domain-containing protein [Acidocella sp. KAb 2-4]|uniref:DUF2189 domain-containing protein n=1 Tax=Acidocella sp. KAb 2-4 TaxID=2885158 RepID=UPI001D0860B8|nr:DUF2189 domain-containing protein [Acidocella sp. KAb 2-4]MCB5944944.1 DUF2189 domain-containing protein [Acidocella sp. KAb 2-4]
MNAVPSAGDSTLLTTSGPAARREFEIRQIHFNDLWEALRLGIADWRACRTEVMVLAVLLPVAAIMLGAVTAAPNLLPFLFPVCAGLALLGPMVTLWFVALSRERERSGVASAEQAAAVFDSSRLNTIQSLGLLCIVLFLAWLAVAGVVYTHTLGQTGPARGLEFFVRVFTTAAGWEMIVLGYLTGAAFALVTLCIGLVSFPLALDQDVSTWQAITVSARAVIRNPVVVLAWGFVVATLMAAGTVPALLGLSVVMPVLGHATWHIYRRLVA